MMLPVQKLESLRYRYAQLEELLCQPHILSDAKKYTDLNRERAELTELVRVFTRYQDATKQLADDRTALSDPDLRELAELEIPELERELQTLEQELNLLLLPSDPNDARNTMLEIRAGTGGEEAALFAADLFRMYTRYAERLRWRVEVLSSSEASAGGLKEIVALISGARVYSVMRFEAGVHRVQRVPATETQGRIHTSTATVAVLPEAEEVDVEIREEDLEIQTTHSGGPGGQHVNTTNSAVQVFHKPSGIMIKAQEERSQHKNKARALQILRAKLLSAAQEAHDKQIADERRGMVGSGDRSEKIRTYNYPQNRVTDHRIGLTLHKLEAIVEGDLEELLSALRQHHQAALLEAQKDRS
ncbi:MAG TPA: peptide chain release factor 1 [Polyangiales bacterium]|nr:peptide chain release factor 1 [Polyangiales bacterium]